MHAVSGTKVSLNSVSVYKLNCVYFHSTNQVGRFKYVLFPSAPQALPSPAQQESCKSDQTFKGSKYTYYLTALTILNILQPMH